MTGDKHVFVDNIASSHPSVHESEAIRAAESAFPGTHNGHPIKLEYFAKEDGAVSLVHSIQIQDFDADVFFEVYVDAHTAEIVSATNFVAEAGVCPFNFYRSRLSHHAGLLVHRCSHYQAKRPSGIKSYYRPSRYDCVLVGLA